MAIGVVPYSDFTRIRIVLLPIRCQVLVSGQRLKVISADRRFD